MKAERTNIINQNRHKLEDVLPLSTPYSVAIDPCNFCNFRCNFCAMQSSNETFSFKKQLMPLELMKKVVDDLRQFPDRIKVIRLAAVGEPLLHPDFVEMVRYAKKSGVAEFLETVTNGSRLNPKLNQELADSGIDRIRISVEEVTGEGYYQIANTKIDFQQFVANVRDLHERCAGKCEIYVKTVDAAADTKEKEERFYQLFEECCDKIWIDHVIPLWPGWEELEENFDLQMKGMHGQELQPIKVCPFPFYGLIINPDGETTVCCGDWKRKYIVGDASRQTLLEIWNGRPMKKLWVDMLSGKKNQYEMCQKCQIPMFDCNDNIDAYADQILGRLDLTE